jgi:hypothetical protein
MRGTAELDAEQVKRDDEVPAALAGLKLETRELQALRHQGFVSRERRGSCSVYRLRFRVDGRQVTRYVGTDAEKAAEVQQSLAEWQAKRCRDLELGRLAREAGRELKRAKRQLTGPLARRGFEFHGLRVRQARSRQK